MLLLAVGVALFSIIHLLPSLAGEQRARLIAAVGEKPYMGLYSVLSLGGLVLAALGWQSADPTKLAYMPPAAGVHITSLAVLIAFILFFSSRAPSNIRRWVRHPQLWGVLLWSFGHLAANGELRSVILFGGFSLWSVIALITSWPRADAQERRYTLLQDGITVAIGTVITYIFAAYLHYPLFGVSPFPV